MLPGPVIASVGHHTGPVLIDDVAAIACSTPTHAADAAVPLQPPAERERVGRHAARLRWHARGAECARAGHSAFSRWPAVPVNTSGAAAATASADARTARRPSAARRAAGCRDARRGSRARRARARGPRPPTKARDRRTGLALAAHDPQRMLARGYAMVRDRAGAPVTSARPCARGRDRTLAFADAASTRESKDRDDRGPAHAMSARSLGWRRSSAALTRARRGCARRSTSSRRDVGWWSTAPASWTPSAAGWRSSGSTSSSRGSPQERGGGGRPGGDGSHEHLRSDRRACPQTHRLRARGSRAQVSSGFLRKSTVIRLHGAGRRAAARTSRTRRASTISSRRKAPSTHSPATGRLDVLRPSRHTRPLRSRARAACLPGLPPLGL